MLSLVKLLVVGIAVFSTTFLVQATPLKAENHLISRDDSPTLYGQPQSHLDQAGHAFDHGPEKLWAATVKHLNPQCNPHPLGKYPDAHKDKVQWAATQFCNIHAGKEADEHRLAPISEKAVIRRPDMWDLADDDNAKALISRVGLGHKWGDSDIFVLSITGVTKEENPMCGEKGGVNGTAATNNLWRPYPEWLCEDFVYAGWRHCANKGMGGSVDISCLRYKFETVY